MIQIIWENKSNKSYKLISNKSLQTYPSVDSQLALEIQYKSLLLHKQEVLNNSQEAIMGKASTGSTTSNKKSSGGLVGQTRNQAIFQEMTNSERLHG